ncbi:MAG: insulinase family protein [Fimbriimonadaceae bacterium]|nr:insulinase family protein [Fimbriimonadaceae bacterium]
MIAAAVGIWLAQVSPITTLPMPESGADTVCVQAFVVLPALSAPFRAQLEVLADTLPKGADNYTEAQIRRYTGIVGRPLRATVGPDYLRLEASCPPDQLATVLGILASVLRAPTLSNEAIEDSVLARSTTTPSDWSIALDPLRLDFRAIRRSDLLDLHESIVRPESTFLCVGGKFDPKVLAEVVAGRFSGWNPRKVVGRFDYERETRSWNPGLRVVSLVGPPISLRAEPYAPLLAAFALGSGKGSSVFRVLREANGWSYRQEAFLWPDREGVRLRTVILSEARAVSPSPEEAKKALIADVAGWGEATRARALGIAEAVLLRDAPYLPIRLSARDHAETENLAGRTRLAGWWFLKTGEVWDPQGVLDGLRTVSLEKMKEVATRNLQLSIGLVRKPEGAT